MPSMERVRRVVVLQNSSVQFQCGAGWYLAGGRKAVRQRESPASSKQPDKASRRPTMGRSSTGHTLRSAKRRTLQHQWSQ